MCILVFLIKNMICWSYSAQKQSKMSRSRDEWMIVRPTDMGAYRFYIH